jgi:hypothetical protein
MKYIEFFEMKKILKKILRKQFSFFIALFFEKTIKFTPGGSVLSVLLSHALQRAITVRDAVSIASLSTSGTGSVVPVGPQVPPMNGAASAPYGARRHSWGPPMDYRDN